MSALLTFGITCFNKEHTIYDCIISCLKVNEIIGEDFCRVVVVDDCSSDKSFSKIKNICTKGIDIIRLEKNDGVSNARNIIIENSNSEYLSFVDGDDKINSSDFALLCTYIRESLDKRIDMFIGNYTSYECDQDIKIKNEYFDLRKTIDSSLLAEAIQNYMLMPNRLSIFSQCFAKVFSVTFLQNNYLKFDTSLFNFEDVDFLAKCVRNTDLCVGLPLDLYVHNLSKPGYSETWSSQRSLISHLGYLTAVDSMALSLETIRNKILEMDSRSSSDSDLYQIRTLKAQAIGAYTCITSVMQAFRVKGLKSFIQYTNELGICLSDKRISQSMKSYDTKLSGGSQYLALAIKNKFWILVALIALSKFHARYIRPKIIDKPIRPGKIKVL